MKVLITADKFRGSLEASQVLKSIENGIHSIDKHIDIDTSVLADGGEGSMKVLSDAFDCTLHKIDIKNAVGIWIKSSLGWNSKTKIAILEMASYAGLAQLKQSQRNPMFTTSYGLGMAIEEASKLGAKKIIIGLGGSATNDGGAGMLSALGFKFFSQDGKEIIPNGGTLGAISKIDPPAKNIWDGIEITLAVDVQNPITGPNGATFTYGKQKGASHEDLVALEKNMHAYASLVQSTTKHEVSEQKGYGAAGGIPLSACTFLKAKIISGSQLIFESLGLERRIRDADLVITGEGKIDDQTVYGKAITPIIKTCLDQKKELIFVCGLYEANDKVLSSIHRFELNVLAKDQNMDSFRDAFALCQKIGERIATLLKK